MTSIARHAAPSSERLGPSPSTMRSVTGPDRKARTRGRGARARMLVIGAGAVGLEIGSVWNRLGAHVTVVELMTPSCDDGTAGWPCS